MSDLHPACGVHLNIPPSRGCINLRGGAEVFSIVAQVLGQELPGIPNTMSFGDYTIYWLGPDEWLILTTENDTSALIDKLGDSLSGIHASVTDISGGQIILNISGIAARNVLSKGCTLNFAPPEGFNRGSCAQSGLAKANVLLGCIDAKGCFEIIVRRSFSDYLLLWLNQAGAEYGLQLTKSQ